MILVLPFSISVKFRINPLDKDLPIPDNIRERFIMSKKVLLVDDSQSCCDYCRRIVEKSGHYELLTALDGQQGLEVFLNEDPAIVITDGKMPQMNGLELAHEIRKQAPDSQVPIVLLTGELDADFSKALKEKVFTFYIPKPVKKEVLLALLKKLIPVE